MDRRETFFRLSSGYENFLQGYKAAKSPAAYSQMLNGYKGEGSSKNLAQEGRSHYTLFDDVVVSTPREQRVMWTPSTKSPRSARDRRQRMLHAERALYVAPTGGMTDGKSYDDLLDSPRARPSEPSRSSEEKPSAFRPSQVAGLKWRNAAAMALMLDKRDTEEIADVKPQVRPSKMLRIALDTVDNEGQTQTPRRTVRQSRMAHASHAWDSVFEKVHESESKIKNPEAAVRKKKDACNSMRMLIFGCLLNENLSMRDQNKIYEERCGTKAQVRKLWELWKRMDSDGSGDIDLDEFVKFFSTNKADRLLSWRAVQCLVHNGRTAKIEDFMKLTWPKAEDEHIQIMMQHFRESAADDQRVPTPRMISRKTRRELRETFRHLDSDGSQQISFEEMVEAGLVDNDTANSLIKQFDKNGDGCIDEREFLEMMAPNGRLAYEDQKECIDIDGNVIEFIENSWFKGWRKKDAPDLSYNTYFDRE